AERVLRGTLASADPFARVAGLDGLERLRARVPFRELEPHLHERLTRKVALQLAGRSGDVAAVPTVTEALSDGVPHVASAAAVALTRLYDDGGACAEAVLAETEVLGASAREILLSTLSHGDPVARQAACRLLVLAREPKAVDGVVDLAAKDSITARELMALSRWGTDVVSLLLAASDRHRGRVRGVALELAAYLAHGPDVAPPTGELSDELRRRIREAVQSSDPDARLAGVRSMLQWGEAEDAALLTAAAKVGPGEVSRAAGQALEALADRHQSAVRESLVPVELDGPGGAALTSLGAKLAEGDVVGRLRAALSSEDAEIRRSAVEALAIVGGADAAEAVGVALTDEDPDVQATAAQVLGRLRDANGHSVGVDKLLVALEAEDSTVRAAAARALGQTKEPRAEEPLRALLDGEEPFVVGAALEGLRLLGKPAVLERIDAFLIHPDEEVAKQALWLVSEIDTGMRISRLAQGLGHAAWDVRQLAAMLLGETRSEEALASLRAKLPEEDYDLVRDAILDAITVLESTR
ncbi:MAG: HEAT repeat domain-containing protein, partial [Myxococcales bacterium]|nr:HEAT repeat domain-containing protein [Myxococcales bacterium]